MDYELLFPGRFVKAVEFKGKDVTLTITKIESDELEGDKGKQVKGIISFQESKKQWVLNKTNALCLVQMWGRETDGWIGHKVTLFPAMLDGEPCIRVKGSPDIEAPISFELKLPRKKARPMKLVVTGKANANAVATGTAPVAPTESGDAPPASHWAAADGKPV